MNFDKDTFKKMLRALTGDKRAVAELQPEIEQLKQEEQAEAERIALAEAEAAALAEKRKHDKYELIPAQRNGTKYGSLCQIRALRDFGDIHAGDLGGHVGSEANLDQKGTCWIYPGSAVMGGARVTEAAKVSGESVIRDRAQVGGSATVYVCTIKDDAMVNGSAEVMYCTLADGSCICDQAKAQNAEIKGNAHICDEVQLWGGEGHGRIVIDGGQLAGKFAMTLSDVFGHARNLSPDGELPEVTERRRRANFEREFLEHRRQAEREAAERLKTNRVKGGREALADVNMSGRQTSVTYTSNGVNG